MANRPQSDRQSSNAKLSGWPRPRDSLAKKMGLNPVRMVLLAVMALAGLAGGYFIGKIYAPAPAYKEAESAPKPNTTAAKHDNHYEEPLPENIVIERNGVLNRILLPSVDAEIDLGNGVFAPIEELTTPDKDKLPEAHNDVAIEGNTTAEVEKGALDTVQPPAAKPRAPETAQASTTAKSIKQIRALPDDIAERQKENAATLPPWQRFALPVKLSDKPLIVIVIDDLGLDRRRSRIMNKLPGPLTLSYMAYADDLENQTKLARQSGHELMIHVPMEPSSSKVNPGPNVLLSGMAEDELQKNIAWSLDHVSGYVGINNHMGSRFTEDRASMKVLVSELKKRGYLFLDSVTSSKTVAHDVARDGGIPYAVRNVFLDHNDDLGDIRTQLRRTEQIAKRTGLAIVIGHPRDNTIEALKEWLPTLDKKGFQLVPISAVVRISKTAK